MVEASLSRLARAALPWAVPVATLVLWELASRRGWLARSYGLSGWALYRQVFAAFQAQVLGRVLDGNPRG